MLIQRRFASAISAMRAPPRSPLQYSLAASSRALHRRMRDFRYVFRRRITLSIRELPRSIVCRSRSHMKSGYCSRIACRAGRLTGTQDVVQRPGLATLSSSVADRSHRLVSLQSAHREFHPRREKQPRRLAAARSPPGECHEIEPAGRCFSGSNPPARSESYSRKYASTSMSLNRISATGA